MDDDDDDDAGGGGDDDDDDDDDSTQPLMENSARKIACFFQMQKTHQVLSSREK